MQILWTPWRLSFIMGPKPSGCIFCDKPGESRDRENYILARGAEAFVILNAYPYNNGHLMIVPYAHTANVEDLSASVQAELMLWTTRAVGALKRAISPEGFNIGMNLGRVAGAGIADHLHLHVVPRWGGDTNFMPVLGETRLIPESLESTYDRLIAAGIAGDG
jgi:ATP adenylyltransferase